MLDRSTEGAKGVSDFVEWDREVVGLGRRFRVASASRWIVQTRVDGKSRKRIIGDADAISVIDARIAARRLLDQIARDTPEEKIDAPDPMATVPEFAERWLRDSAARWKPRTFERNRYVMMQHIAPAFGAARVRDLCKTDVLAWRDKLTVAPRTVNLYLALLSGVMRHAELLGVIPPGSNPCKGLRKKDLTFKARYLNETEYRRLGRALVKRAEDNPNEVDLIRFIALTGCRKSEALGLRWDRVEGNAVRLPDSKTGPTTIWLGAPARALLASIERNGSFVFGLNETKASQQRLWLTWNQVRKDARLKDVRLDDLRHSFASSAIRTGESLRTVGGLLGHSDPETTAGYAHLGVEDMRSAAGRVGAVLATKIDQPKGRSRVPYKRPAKPRRVKAPRAVRDFMKTGKSISTFCTKRDLDPDAFRAELLTWRRQTGRL